MLESLQFTRRAILGATASTALLSAGGHAQAASAATQKRAAKPGQIPVAYLVDRNLTLIDFIGPLEAFEDAPQAKVPGFFGYSVGQERRPYLTQSGIELIPEFTFDDAPLPKVLVIAAQAGWTPEKLAWIRKVHEQADAVMSVCTGAFLLAESGLLKGLKATTHHEFYDKFAARYPDIELVREKRFVDNGKIITTGGLTSGVDGALHVISRYHGEPAAQIVADYMEHRRGPWRDS